MKFVEQKTPSIKSSLMRENKLVSNYSNHKNLADKLQSVQEIETK